MNVLLLSQYFPPEVGATQMRADAFASHLATAGHDVTVVAEVPSHPTGVISAGFRRRAFYRSREKGYAVVRLWVAASPKKTFWRRIVFYATYAINAVLAAFLIVRRRPDVVFATSPPLPVALAGLTIATVYRRPFVADIRDIWPAVGEALGELKPGRAMHAAQALERLVYRRAAAVTAVTQTFVDHIVELGAFPEAVHLIPNGTLPEVFNPDRKDPMLRSEVRLSDGLVVGYIGLHGIAQGLGAVVDAAAELRNDGVQFLLAGEGPVKDDLKQHAQTIGATNVVFHDQVPLEAVARYINACDVMVVPLRRLEILEGFIPSKLFDYMACAKPVIIMVDGEARAIVEEANCGVYVEAENAEALASAVRTLRADPENAQRMGESGRQHVLEHYVRARQAEQLERILADVCAKHP